MKINVKLLLLLLLLLSIGVAKADLHDENTVSCQTEDGTAKVFLKRSTDDLPHRSIWVEKDGKKEKIWDGKREKGLSIATNRTPAELIGPEPDPYESMELVKASFNGDVLVVIAKTKLNMEKQKNNNASYAGGFFFDQITNTKRRWSSLATLPPHSDYSWELAEWVVNGKGEVSKVPNNFEGYQAPWNREHNGYEYFLRSFVKNSKGEWLVHVSAALSVLWADSLGLPISTLTIEDKDTYTVKFEGKYKYFTIDARKEIDDLFEGVTGRVNLFDFYGEIEKLIYKGAVLPGETIESIKCIHPTPATQEQFLEQIYYPDENDLDYLLSRSKEAEVYTTLHGGKSFYRVAYNKDLWRGLNSWVGHDELTIDQVHRMETREDNLSTKLFTEIGRIEGKIKGGSYPLGYKQLRSGEIRQTYCLDIYKAQKLLKDRIRVAAANVTNDDLSIKRDLIYLELINKALENQR